MSPQLSVNEQNFFLVFKIIFCWLLNEQKTTILEDFYCPTISEWIFDRIRCLSLAGKYWQLQQFFPHHMYFWILSWDRWLVVYLLFVPYIIYTYIMPLSFLLLISKYKLLIFNRVYFCWYTVNLCATLKERSHIVVEMQYQNNQNTTS